MQRICLKLFIILYVLKKIRISLIFKLSQYSHPRSIFFLDSLCIETKLSFFLSCSPVVSDTIMVTTGNKAPGSQVS
jgi:hypothetical protein